MSAYEMPIAVTYVKDWGIVEMAREIFQNAIDQGDWKYEIENDILQVTSKNVELSRKTLLMGFSEKREGAIGRFGEGMKLALLVAARLGKPARIVTGKDVWIPRIVNSRRYGAPILAIDVHRSLLERSANTYFGVMGLTDSELEAIKTSNLYMQNRAEETILEDQPGRIYVGGLFVCTVKDLVFGYNFPPNGLKLDRDRRLASDFDVQWETSKLWARRGDEQALTLIEEDKPDVAYLSSQHGTASLSLKLAERHVERHGPNAIPVASQWEAESLPAGYKPVIVNTRHSAFLRSVIPIPREEKPTLREQVKTLVCEECWDKLRNLEDL